MEKVRIQDDLYNYVNGEWIEKAVIPADIIIIIDTTVIIVLSISLAPFVFFYYLQVLLNLCIS